MLERWTGAPTSPGSSGESLPGSSGGGLLGAPSGDASPPGGAPAGPLDRWKVPLTGLCLAVAIVGAGLWLARRPVDRPIALPTAAVEASTARTVKVHVTGAVAQPGLYTLADGQRVADAIEQAGGALAGAELARVNLAARLRDQQQIVVPAGPAAALGDATAVAAPSGTRSAARTGRATVVAHPAGKVNLNQASQAELEALPGIGAVTARRIVQYRAEHGAFASIEDVRRARLIAPAAWARLQDLVDVR